MTDKYVCDDVVHYGHRFDFVDGPRVWLLCERARLIKAQYGGPGHSYSLGALDVDRPLVYKPGVEAFLVFDDVDCMTCLVLEARRGINS